MKIDKQTHAKLIDYVLGGVGTTIIAIPALATLYPVEGSGRFVSTEYLSDLKYFLLFGIVTPYIIAVGFGLYLAYAGKYQLGVVVALAVVGAALPIFWSWFLAGGLPHIIHDYYDPPVKIEKRIEKVLAPWAPGRRKSICKNGIQLDIGKFQAITLCDVPYRLHATLKKGDQVLLIGRQSYWVFVTDKIGIPGQPESISLIYPTCPSQWYFRRPYC